MSFLPVTVFFVLAGSLVYALLFGPSIGTLAGHSRSRDDRAAGVGAARRRRSASAKRIHRHLRATSGRRLPPRRFDAAGGAVVLGTVYLAYGQFGRGMVFFSDGDPERARIAVRARGNLQPFNHLRRQHPDLDYVSLIVRTGAQRLRPVLLTTATTVLGLLPLASHFSIDFINRSIIYGGLLSSFWVPLAQPIVSGLAFATLLTLIATPALLAMPYRTSVRNLTALLDGSGPDVGRGKTAAVAYRATPGPAGEADSQRKKKPRR